jgi:hypothetical protein
LVLQQWLKPNSTDHAWFGDLTDASVLAASDSCRSGPLQWTLSPLPFSEVNFPAIALSDFLLQMAWIAFRTACKEAWI